MRKWTAALVIPGLLWLSGCGKTEPPPPGGVASPGGPKVVGTVLATEGDVSKLITQPATLQGIEEASLFSRASGYVKEIRVDKGSRVRQGEVLAIIESPELQFQQQQAKATYDQSVAGTRSAEASRGRATADTTQAQASVEKARAEVRQAAAVIDRAESDLAKAQAQLPKMQAAVRTAEATVGQTIEQQGQAEADVTRWQLQVVTAQAALAAVRASQSKAESDQRLQRLTYQRLKAIQDRDAGLVTGQDVDVARARMESADSEFEALRSRMDAARGEVSTAEQQVNTARRAAAAATKRVDAVRSQLDGAREDVRIGQRDIESARQQVKVTQAQRDAAEKQVAVAQGQHQALTQQEKVSDAMLSGARLQSKGSQSALSSASAIAGFTRIVAPFDGIVTERLADRGAFVQNATNNQASARPILKVVRDGTLRVGIPVPETAVPSIRVGQPAEVTVDALPKTPFRGRVSRFAAALDPKSRTMLVEVDIQNSNRQLRPGMYARVALTLGVHAKALSIPSEAVMGPEDKRFVYTVVSGKALRTPVTTGIDNGKTVEILSGLTKDVPVVLVGRDTLTDGVAVKASPAPVTTGK